MTARARPGRQRDRAGGRGRGVAAPLALWLAAALAACSPPQAPSIALGERAPEFSRRDLDGSEIALSSFAGQPVVLNFWATWCQPCRREFPGLRELEAAGAARVVGVALDEEGAERVRPFVDRERLDYTILIGDRSLFALYDGLVIPYTLLLDGELRIANIYRGPVDKSRLEEDLARLAARGESRPGVVAGAVGPGAGRGA